jgi:hypothetical protein
VRWFAKHRGLRQADRVRRLLLFSLRVRVLLFRGERREQYREGVRFLASGRARDLIS